MYDLTRALMDRYQSLALPRAIEDAPLEVLRDVMHENVESPGTKAYAVREARNLVNEVGFRRINPSLFVDSGDLLTLKLNSKSERNRLASWAFKYYPRGIVKRLGNRLGTTLYITAVK